MGIAGTFPIKRNTKYWASLWVRSDVIRAITLSLEWFDHNGGWVGEDNFFGQWGQASVGPFSVASQWVNLSGEWLGTEHDDITQADIWLTINNTNGDATLLPAGEAHVFDDFEIREVIPDPAPTQLFAFQKGSYFGTKDTLGAQDSAPEQTFDDFGVPQTTPEFWDADGHGLSTMAYNIETFTGRVSIPTTRGQNIVAGNRPGAKWVKKPADQRKITLAMWVRGGDEWGAVQFPQLTAEQIFNQNVRTLQRMFAQYGRQIILTKRVNYPEGILKMSTAVEPTGEMNLDMHGRTAAAFTVDLLAADPFWYEDQSQGAGILTPTTGVGIGGPLIDPVGFGGVPHYDTFLGVGGTQPAFPTFYITGPVSAPLLEIAPTGQSFRWRSGLSAGEQLVANMKDNTVEVGNQPRFGEVDRAHDDVISFPPDTLVRVRFKADSYDPSASYTVVWNNTHT